jgi:hypothetical protein
MRRMSQVFRAKIPRTGCLILNLGNSAADAEVADDGPNGHSVFTWALLRGYPAGARSNRPGRPAEKFRVAVGSKPADPVLMNNPNFIYYKIIETLN